MSGRLGALEAQIGTAQQLQAVVSAMRGIAAARAREAEGRLAGIRSTAATVAAAIGEVLRVEPDRRAAAAPDETGGKARSHARHLVIVMGSEQGFVGMFNEPILDAATRALQSGPCELIVTGTRGATTAEERSLSIAWSTPMVTHADDVPGFASNVTDELYRRLEDSLITRVSIIHAVPALATQTEVVQRQLIPFDFARFHVTSRKQPPLLTLPADKLLTGLAEAYVYTELCEAAALSLAAENEARVRAMMSAHANLKDRLDALTQRYRLVRQDEITSDIVELTAAASVARAD
ncbi:F0F1 ATP synthase subunit gamma [Paraburkholderia kururiensis]|uniref:F0F1 ATP synthase subunit gamma n=1 Tax=Paraburkholderia kururiensis TaxID=984307 RepID=UPI0005A84842|nr:FoF1 ATP synthase subunit gamma [Paraburkholderia kururiensis]